MKNNFIKEIAVAVVIIVLAILLLNPFHFWMPNMIVVGMLAMVLILFGVFASFILQEKIFDERDNAHRSLAGRNAFLAGALVLMIGIVTEGYSHSIDPFLVVALIAMVVIKIASRIWSSRHL